MKLDIRSRGFELTPSLRSHAERRLAFALSRFSQRVSAVILRMEDTNGPKGGADMRCRIETRLEGQAAVIAEATGTDLYGAIDLASERVGRAVARSIQRTLTRQPQGSMDWMPDEAQV